jgi:hypothetical protein
VDGDIVQICGNNNVVTIYADGRNNPEVLSAPWWVWVILVIGILILLGLAFVAGLILGQKQSIVVNVPKKLGDMYPGGLNRLDKAG